MLGYLKGWSVIFAVSTVLAQSAYAKPGQATEADKADLACLNLLEYNRTKMLEGGNSASQKPELMQGMLQMTAFYLGKLTARHPGSSLATVARSIDMKSPEMKPLFDANRCANEFRNVIQRKGD